MITSRREFLSGASAFALGGTQLFAAPSGWKSSRKPNLVFGVISDTHLQATRSGQPSGYAPHKYFITALEHFRKANVDAVLHLGDMANVGQVEAMQFHADIWRKVFGKKGPEKLFVAGNHDLEGGGHGDYALRNYPDPDVRARKMLVTDMAGNWKHIWGEEYLDVWHKDVKGYHFFGRQWGVEENTFSDFVANCAEEYSLVKSLRPSFILSHGRLLTGFRNAVRPSMKNAMILFGHCHMSATNWNSIYMYNETVETIPSVQCPPCIGPDWGINADCNNVAYISKGKLEGHDEGGKGRQGLVIRVYDDLLTIERLCFNDGVSVLGADWVMPFRTKPHPFTKGELKKAIGKPQFSKKVKLEVSKKGDSLNLRIPPADCNPDSRVYAYDVVVAGDEGTPKLFKAVYAVGCNLGICYRRKGEVTTLEIPESELPSGKKLTVAVRPLTSLGTSGRPIIAKLKM